MGIMEKTKLFFLGIVGIMFVIALVQKPRAAIIGLIVPTILYFSPASWVGEDFSRAFWTFVILLGIIQMYIIKAADEEEGKKIKEVKTGTRQLDSDEALDAINRELERRQGRRK